MRLSVQPPPSGPPVWVPVSVLFYFCIFFGVFQLYCGAVSTFFKLSAFDVHGWALRCVGGNDGSGQDTNGTRSSKDAGTLERQQRRYGDGGWRSYSFAHRLVSPAPPLSPPPGLATPRLVPHSVLRAVVVRCLVIANATTHTSKDHGQHHYMHKMELS